MARRPRYPAVGKRLLTCLCWKRADGSNRFRVAHTLAAGSVWAAARYHLSGSPVWQDVRMSTGWPRMQTSTAREQSPTERKGARGKRTAPDGAGSGRAVDGERTDGMRTENQARILDVAVRQFTEEGLAGARVAEIAELAGLSRCSTTTTGARQACIRPLSATTAGFT